ncbi:hypothetical protein OHC33_003616 [Knufia fluminis]|uniref:Uncharacterized protein n=1 Tax=Knufia fluminis TaxID=191047 RepID=A0AAN8IPB9_9EURO|nr:hypothetical protein OHC33_003616 [Knufia fluminis]
MFAARRKPKRVVSSDTREDGSNQQDEDNGPVVRRPNAAPKTKSKLRMSFDPTAESTADDQPTAIPPKPSGLGASALSRNPTVTPSVSERDRDEPRPSYSKSYLDELKGSTPSTPKDLSLYNSSAEETDDLPLTKQTQSLDIASKFGTPSTTLPNTIPSASEIQEKKDRRLRLAREQQANTLGPSTSNITTEGNSVSAQDDFISLDAYDSDGEFKPSRMQISTHLHNDRLANAQEYTRLVPEDEDIAEGFEAFINDDHERTQKSGRILMGMKSSDALERQRMREMIHTAEGGGSGGSDDDSDNSNGSDASASNAYMAAQTSHGVGFSNLSKDERRRHEKEARRPRQPEKTTPIPTLAAGLARLRELQSSAEMNRERAEMRKAEIRRRLEEVEGEKGRIQRALEDLGGQLEETSKRVVAQREGENGNGNDGGGRTRQGGLEDIGGWAQ